MRDSYPAALVQVEVLAKRLEALIVYGHRRFQRRQIMVNFECFRSGASTTPRVRWIHAAFRGDAMVPVPPGAACHGAGFLDERLRRIALTGIPAFEADRVRRLCAKPTPRR